MPPRTSTGRVDVIAVDPFDLDAGDRIEFFGVVSGATTYPTGSSFAAFFGYSNIYLDNASPDLVTVSFDVGYDYAISSSVDDPVLEYAAAGVGYFVFTEEQLNATESDSPDLGFFELFQVVEFSDSQAEAGAASFEFTLPAGQTETISVSAHAIGDPEGTVPEPTTYMLGAIGAAMLSGAARKRRSPAYLDSSSD